jgi:hypothetical protein
MGIELAAINCSKCGVPITNSAGPNWMHIPTPAPRDWAVVTLFCPNPNCKEPMGTYAYPLK